MKNDATPIYGNDDPTTQADLDAYVAASAHVTHEAHLIEDRRVEFDAITVTLFDKRTGQEAQP